MSTSALNTYPVTVVKVLLALVELEREHGPGAAATYQYLRGRLNVQTRGAAYHAVLRARRFGLVEVARTSRGGRGESVKAAFRLTSTGREALH